MAGDLSPSILVENCTGSRPKGVIRQLRPRLSLHLSRTRTCSGKKRRCWDIIGGNTVEVLEVVVCRFLRFYAVSIFSCLCIPLSFFLSFSLSLPLSFFLLLSPRFSVLFSELPGLSSMTSNVAGFNVVRHFPSQIALILSFGLYHSNLVINTLIVVWVLCNQKWSITN